MRKMKAFLLVICLITVLVTPAYAEPDMDLGNDYVYDMEGLISDSEEQSLQSELEELCEQYQVEVYIVTVEDLQGKSAQDMADDLYDESGMGYGADDDGILLLVSEAEGKWHISTHGYGITVITDAGLDYMSEQFVPYLSEGEFADAFQVFAEQCDDFLRQARSGDPYDSHNLPKGPFPTGMFVLIGLVIGVVVAFIVLSSMSSKMKTVRSQTAAAEYVKAGSMEITVSQDRFLYSNVARVKRQSSSGSSTHRSSSGRTHGGGGGSF